MAKKTERQLAKEAAWNAFSRYIRTRDCLRFTGDPDEGKCVSCSRFYPFKKLQAGHFIGGRGNAVLFAEDITYSQCYGCNVGKSGNYLDYYYFMESELGSKEAVDELVIKYKQMTGVVYKIHDLKEIRTKYDQMTKDLLT